MQALAFPCGSCAPLPALLTVPFPSSLCSSGFSCFPQHQAGVCCLSVALRALPKLLALPQALLHQEFLP